MESRLDHSASINPVLLKRFLTELGPYRFLDMREVSVTEDRIKISAPGSSNLNGADSHSFAAMSLKVANRMLP